MPANDAITQLGSSSQAWLPSFLQMQTLEKLGPVPNYPAFAALQAAVSAPNATRESSLEAITPFFGDKSAAVIKALGKASIEKIGRPASEPLTAAERAKAKIAKIKAAKAAKAKAAASASKAAGGPPASKRTPVPVAPRASSLFNRRRDTKKSKGGREHGGAVVEKELSKVEKLRKEEEEAQDALVESGHFDSRLGNGRRSRSTGRSALSFAAPGEFIKKAATIREEEKDTRPEWLKAKEKRLKGLREKIQRELEAEKIEDKKVAANPFGDSFYGPGITPATEPWDVNVMAATAPMLADEKMLAEVNAAVVAGLDGKVEVCTGDDPPVPPPLPPLSPVYPPSLAQARVEGSTGRGPLKVRTADLGSHYPAVLTPATFPATAHFLGLIHHPVPIPPLDGPKREVALPIRLTNEERKKIKKKTKQEKLRLSQDKQRLGLVPPPPPRIRMGNLARILATQSITNPTALVEKVKKIRQKRVDAHNAQNQARKLTKDEKANKMAHFKAIDDRSKSMVIFRIGRVTVKQMAKIKYGMRDYKTAGVLLLNHCMCIVIVEGGLRAVRKMGHLLSNRMNWQEVEVGKSDSRVNFIEKVWEGRIQEACFQGYKTHKFGERAQLLAFMDDHSFGEHFHTAWSSHRKDPRALVFINSVGAGINSKAPDASTTDPK